MIIRRTNGQLKRGAIAGAFAASALALTACSNDTAGSEAGADVEDIVEDNAAEIGMDDYTPFEDFAADMDSYVGEKVTVSAEVSEVISDKAFLIAGTEDTTLEPLLVISAKSNADVEEEAAVAVTGTVHGKFVVTKVEDELGIDLDDDLFADWEQEHYITAENISLDVPQDEGDA